VSVDTHLKGKNTTNYRRYQEQGIEILVAHSLMSWAYGVELDRKQFLFWNRIKPVVEHKHRPS